MVLRRKLEPRRTLGPAYRYHVPGKQRVSGQLVPLAFPIHLQGSTEPICASRYQPVSNPGTWRRRSAGV